jgi:hypothetical protein
VKLGDPVDRAARRLASVFEHAFCAIDLVFGPASYTRALFRIA